MRLTLLAAFVFSCLALQAQQYARVKINLDQTHTFTQLAGMGLDTDHGRLQPGKYFISEFSDVEIEKIKAAGFSTEILIEDLEAHRHALKADGATVSRSLACSDFQPNTWETPANYHDGSMGGYFTYQEMLDNLDAMAALYPDLFKARKPITTSYQTHEGRPVFWVKISDNPDTEESAEPQVLYTAVHHAREPNSLSQLIFYMWYLLENYETNEEVKYLVDNVEMYFIPCVNPDGYIYNETNSPNGGGFWRKNRRNNGNGTFGVDLNRNYGHEWGFDNTGSSPNPDAQTYRGPGPFSEPETQMVRDFCDAHKFQLALNYHTYGNLLIFPWGYIDSATPDHATFQGFAGIMDRENDFLTGFGSQTVGYTVNGDSDDWMYGEQTTKPKIYSMTPEVGPGNFGFWPPQSAIDDLNKTCMYMNLATAHLALNYGELTPESSRFISGLQGKIEFDLQKFGLGQGALKVSLNPVSDNIISTGSPKTYGLFHLEKTSNSITFNLDPDVEEGDSVVFEMTLDNGLYTWRQTVVRVFTKNATQEFLEPGDDLTQWTPFTDWDVTDETFFSAPSSLTDSPDAPYLPNNISEISMKEPVTVKNATGVYLNFWAKWNIEEDEDYAQVLLSVNGGSFFPLCGRYTEPGTAEQSPDQPVYDGIEANWVQEEIDLTEYLSGDSTQLNIAFRMVSDEFIEADGYYFDDFAVTVVKEGTVTSTIEMYDSNFTMTTRPNPASNYVIIDLSGETENSPKMELQVFNALGQMMVRQAVQGNIFRVETEGWQPGIYQYRLKVGEKWAPSGRFMVSGK
jgi:carboxypeptidase T